jgi:hypothetical protein
MLVTIIDNNHFYDRRKDKVEAKPIDIAPIAGAGEL